MANYSIIGDDGKEYGPVPAAELQNWVAQGRAGPRTKVRAEGSTEWMLLSTVPELGDAVKKTPPSLPRHAPPPAGKMSAMAVISLVLGVLGLFTCGGTALFGLILGIIAMVKVGNSRGELRGKGLALAGVIVSGVFLLLIPISAAMLLPALAAAKGKAQAIVCMNNEKQLAVAVRLYSASNANHFPPAATWCDAIKASVGSDKVFKCPAVVPSDNCDYAFNAKLDGLDVSKVDPQTVLIFESNAGSFNAHGGPEMAAQHHGKSMNVAFADGHVERVTEDRFSTLRWDP